MEKPSGVSTQDWETYKSVAKVIGSISRAKRVDKIEREHFVNMAKKSALVRRKQT